MPPQREDIRLAAWLRDLWQTGARRVAADEGWWAILETSWAGITVARRRLALAQRRGLTLCLPRLEEMVRSCLGAHSEQTASASRDDRPRPARASLGDAHWYQEVLQLREDFAAVTFLRREGKLSVHTEPVVLEGVPLGAFAIELAAGRFCRRGGTEVFAIKALDPRPAVVNRSCVHPHVQDSELCAGDGKFPIQLALEEGRLADAFLIVRSVLQTYNGDSAYVRLTQWTSEPCEDCRLMVEPQELSSCRACGSSVCEDCLPGCVECSTPLCRSCLHSCADCGGDYCRQCLDVSACSDHAFCSQCRAACDRCEAVVGTRELDGDRELCRSCREELEALHDDGQLSVSPPTHIEEVSDRA